MANLKKTGSKIGIQKWKFDSATYIGQACKPLISIIYRVVTVSGYIPMLIVIITVSIIVITNVTG